MLLSTLVLPTVKGDLLYCISSPSYCRYVTPLWQLCMIQIFSLALHIAPHFSISLKRAVWSCLFERSIDLHFNE